MVSDRICTVDGCTSKHVARGWCHKHWQRWRAHGDPLATLVPGRGLSTLDRVLLRIDFTGPCWEWQGFLGSDGYPQISVRVDGRQRTTMKPYRILWEELVGPIPDGLTIDHLCRNIVCCNPDHLEPVTQWVNSRRGYGLAGMNARKTHCPQGHPYDEANTMRSPDGLVRICRACKQAQTRRRYGRIEAAS